jgi:hypothetical protein
MLETGKQSNKDWIKRGIEYARKMGTISEEEYLRIRDNLLEDC